MECFHCKKESSNLDFLQYCSDCISISLQREEELDNAVVLSPNEIAILKELDEKLKKVFKETT